MQIKIDFICLKISSPKKVLIDANFEKNVFGHINLNNNDKLIVALLYRSPSGKVDSENSPYLLKMNKETTNLDDGRYELRYYIS